MAFDPLPSMLDKRAFTPASSPSKTGGRSILRLAEALGSLWFSTTNTRNPFLRTNSCGSSNWILGAGPGAGC